MNVKFYMAVHVPKAVTIALRVCGIDSDMLREAATFLRVKKPLLPD